MRIVFKALIAIGLFAAAAPAFAQDDQEIIVTGSRMVRDGYESNLPTAVATLPATSMRLRRTADFALQQVTIGGDTRDEEKRREEIFAMLRGAIALAPKFGVQLATGGLVVEPLTLANYRDLAVTEDEERSDAELVTFFVKTPLAAGVDSKTALDRITKFIAAVQTVGRAEMTAQGDLGLSVVNPEQYRGAIINLVAKDAASAAASFGPGYGVEVTGLDRPIVWERAGLTDVFLYLPSNYTIRPKP